MAVNFENTRNTIRRALERHVEIVPGGAIDDDLDGPVVPIRPVRIAEGIPAADEAGL